MKEKIEKLEKLYQEMDELTPENMETLVAESLHAFEQILEKLQSGSDAEKEQAQKYADQLKTQLEKQAEEAVSALKISHEELEAFTNNRENFSDEEWEALSQAKEELASYRKHIQETKTVEELKNERTPRKTRRARSAQWVAG
ncbi:MAG: hypothetical protein AAGF04_02750 [Chlamydiota bacterium]